MRKLPPNETLAPFPGIEPSSPGSATYLLSNYGWVQRVDRARDEDADYQLILCRMVPRADFLVVRLGGGKHTKSVPAAIQVAFGNLPRPVHNPDKRGQQSGQSWRLRIDPDAPLDDETEQPRCSVVDVEWLYCPTHSQLFKGQIDKAPPHHVIPVWVPNPKDYPRYRDLKDFHNRT